MHRPNELFKKLVRQIFPVTRYHTVVPSCVNAHSCVFANENGMISIVWNGDTDNTVIQVYVDRKCHFSKVIEGDHANEYIDYVWKTARHLEIITRFVRDYVLPYLYRPPDGPLYKKTLANWKRTISLAVE